MNSTADPGVVGDDELTLREAMRLAVGNLALSSLSSAEVTQVSGNPGIASADTVHFDPDVFPPDGPATIAISDTVGTLPTLSTNDDTLDASDVGVIVDGSGLSGSVDGFTIASQRNTIRGFQIINFPGSGIALINHAKFTVVGGDRTRGSGPSGEGNVIFGNGDSGIRITGSDTMSNTVSGNLIGTVVTGTAAAPVGNRHGVEIASRARTNIIGGTTTGEMNLISGNRGDGVRVVGAHSNYIIGNHIGTDITGEAAIGNAWGGVNILQAATHNVIGGSMPGESNVISGNALYGVAISGMATEWNHVLGNLVGTDVSGLLPLSNGSEGIRIHSGARYNVIGGSKAGEGNIISGNQTDGVQIRFSGTAENQVLGNLIGTDINSLSVIPNGALGVSISEGAQVNTIGGAEVGSGNVIAGNRLGGVSIMGAGTISNAVWGNYIGTDVRGVATLGNGGHGVWVSSQARNNVIGGYVPGAGNIIVNSGGDGIRITNPSSRGNTLLGNAITQNAGLGIENADGGNGELPPPVLVEATTIRIQGTAVISTPLSTQGIMTVEIFSDDADEGRVFEGRTTVDEEGVFVFEPSVPLAGPNITATVTDFEGNTSEFSAPVLLSPPPRYALWLPLVLRERPLPTATPTSTPLPISTDTPTPSATASPTHTPTLVLTDTPSPAATASSTRTPTVTATPSAMPTPTVTSTPENRSLDDISCHFIFWWRDSSLNDRIIYCTPLR